MIESKYQAYQQIALGLIFIVWGAICFIWRTLPGSPFLAIAGVFIIYGGVIHYFRYIRLSNLVANILVSNPRISLRKIAEEAGLTEKRVKKILRFLKAEGRLKSTFDPTTGDLIVYEIDGHRTYEYTNQAQPMQPTMPRVQQPVPPSYPSVSKHHNAMPQQQGYNARYTICPYCGTIVPPDAKFCPNCGATLK